MAGAQTGSFRYRQSLDVKSKFDPQKHHRRSIRLKGYDYSSEGAYFITVVTQGREYLFGEIVDGEMVLNDAGQMIIKWWNELPHKFPNINFGEFVVMPNHFHGIIFIIEPVGVDLRVDPEDVRVSPEEEKGGHTVRAASTTVRDGIGPPVRPSLSKMIQWFKTMTTNEYIREVKRSNWKSFAGRLWQRNFYERIIRNEEELRQTTDYILDNPSRWEDDDENPFVSI